MSILFATLMMNEYKEIMFYKNRGYITIRLERYNALLMCKSTLGSSTYRFLIDTGAADDYIDASFVKNEDRHLITNGRIKSFKIGNAALGELVLLTINLDSVNNSYSQNSIPTIIGLIGSKTLLSLDAIVDCGRSRMHIKLRKK